MIILLCKFFNFNEVFGITPVTIYDQNKNVNTEMQRCR